MNLRCPSAIISEREGESGQRERIEPRLHGAIKVTTIEVAAA